MSAPSVGLAFDPSRDLVLERVVDIPPAAVWAAWTVPAQLVRWFTPDPWQTIDAEIDLRPGGTFRTVMRSPEGTEIPGTGCVLEVVPERRFVWTSALGPGFRPRSAEEIAETPFFFTGVIALEPHGDGGTRYTATTIHADAAGRDQHAAMGFEVGWGAALDQLVAMVRGER